MALRRMYHIPAVHEITGPAAAPTPPEQPFWRRPRVHFRGGAEAASLCGGDRKAVEAAVETDHGRRQGGGYRRATTPRTLSWTGHRPASQQREVVHKHEETDRHVAAGLAASGFRGSASMSERSAGKSVRSGVMGPSATGYTGHVPQHLSRGLSEAPRASTPDQQWRVFQPGREEEGMYPCPPHLSKEKTPRSLEAPANRRFMAHVLRGPSKCGIPRPHTGRYGGHMPRLFGSSKASPSSSELFPPGESSVNFESSMRDVIWTMRGNWSHDSTQTASHAGSVSSQTSREAHHRAHLHRFPWREPWHR
jgi:hypothetical protein